MNVVATVIIFGRIRWTAFGSRRARGKGRILISDCRPDCAGGSFGSWRAVIRAKRVRNLRDRAFSIPIKQNIGA